MVSQKMCDFYWATLYIRQYIHLGSVSVLVVVCIINLIQAFICVIIVKE